METPLQLLRGAQIVTTDGLRRADLLVAAGTIVATGDVGDIASSRAVTVTDLDGLTLAPGLVDAHVHILGGGGGDGFDTRAPELPLTELTLNGITTAVGAPGVDMASRSMEGLLAKAQGLERDGITAFAYAGGFHRPPATVTGTPWRDCYLLPRVVGVKIVVGETRAASYTAREIADLARELEWVRRATGRGAVLHVHFGRQPDGRALLLEALPQVPSPEHVVVTHCNFSRETLTTAASLARLGVGLDVSTALSPDRGTSSAILAADAIDELLAAGVAAERLSLSSDGNGEVPRRIDGGWEPYRTHMDSLLEAVGVIAGRHSLSLAFALAAANPARAIGLASSKGTIAVGADADLIALDGDHRVVHLYARGRRLVERGVAVVKGRFETAAEPR